MSALVVLAFSGALVLAGCGDDEAEIAAFGEGDTSHSTTSATPTSEPSTSPASTTEPSSQPVPSSTPEELLVEALVGEACLPGNWFLDNEEFTAFMASVSGSPINDMSGSVMVTFREDGTTSTSYDEWTYAMAAEGRSITLVKNGTDSGTYAVSADGGIALTDTNMGSTLDSHMEMNGEVVAMSMEPGPSVFSEASFVCEGEKLAMTTDGATTILHREH